MTMTNEYAELSLEGFDMESALASTDRLLIQCNKEEGAPFNFTQVQLIAKSTGIQTVSVAKQDTGVEYFNLNGQRVAHPNKGLYIVNGKKVIVGK